MKNLRFLLSAAALCAALAPSAAFAADGSAFDSVTKFSMGGGPVEPGDFATDFAAAAAAPTPPPRPGGMLGALGGAMAGMAQSGMAMFANGIAERHYVAGQLRRVDEVAAGTATITDCKARTLTMLDLNKKTYRVVSMDNPQPAAAPAQPAGPRPAYTIPPDARFDLTVTNSALGPKTVFGMQTEGYASHMVTTSTENGQTHTGEFDLTLYVAGQPGADNGACGSAGPSTGPPMAAAMAGMAAALTSHADPRFTVHSSGPAIPFGRFTPYLASAPKSGGSGGGAQGSFAMIEERANLRSISDADPVFSVPPGFTKLP